MQKYERLTKRAGWHKDIDLKDELGYSYIYQRLAELENAIEDGEHFRLPCKVGDDAYFVVKLEKGWDMQIGYVSAISIDKDGIWIACKYDSGLSYWHKDKDKDLFFNANKAHKYLKELENGKN